MASAILYGKYSCFVPSRFRINFISFLALNFGNKLDESIGKVGLKFSDRNLPSGHFENVIF